MSDIALKIQLASEIEILRTQLSEEWKQHRILSHPSVVDLSQNLDSKINEYINLSSIKKIIE